MDRSVLRSALAAVLLVFFFLQMCISAKVLNDQFEQKDLDKTNGATPFLAVWSIIAFCTNFAFAVLLLQSSRPEGEKFDHSVVALAHLNFWVTMVLFGLACKQPGAKMGDGQSLGSTQKAMSGWGILACLFTLPVTFFMGYQSSGFGGGAGGSAGADYGYQPTQYQQGGYQDPYQPPASEAGGYRPAPAEGYSGLPPQQQ